MAVDYEQYQRTSEVNKSEMTNAALLRIRECLRLGPKQAADLSRFFKDIYLLEKTSPLGYTLEIHRKTQEFAAHPIVRQEFVSVLRHQDISVDSREVLATLQVGEMFDYGKESPFRIVFDKLQEKHTRLIAEAERKRREEAEARRQARSGWPPRESNIGKSVEWVQIQERTAQLWEQRKQTLPQGIERERDSADLEYVSAGFDIIKNEVINGSATESFHVRAMLEYLIPEMWRKPAHVKGQLKSLEDGFRPGSGKKLLRDLPLIQKILFVPSALHNLSTIADQEQRGKIVKMYRLYNQALHPDLGNGKDTSTNLLPYVAIIHRTVNNTWDKGRTFN